MRSSTQADRSVPMTEPSDTATSLKFFVVISDQGPGWADAVPMREQDLWAEHAVFMNGLADDGFVMLGGPIGDATRHRARLIVKAHSEAEARERLAADPWA